MSLIMKSLENLPYIPSCTQCGNKIKKSYKPRHLKYYQDDSNYMIWCVPCVKDRAAKRKTLTRQRELETCEHYDCEVISTDFNGNPKIVKCKFCEEVNYL